MQMIREVKPGFQVLVGSAPTLAPSLASGRGGCGAGVCQRRALRDASPSGKRTGRRETEAAKDWQNRIAEPLSWSRRNTAFRV